MRVIARKALRDFSHKHAETAGALDIWNHLVKGRMYRTPHEVRIDFPDASFLGNGITVFNIGSCRLEVHMRYDIGFVFIRSIATHEEYDRRNKARRNR